MAAAGVLTILAITSFLLSCSASYCSGFGGKVHHGLFVADPGTFSGTPEEIFYLYNLQGKSVNSTRFSFACGSVTFGTIMGMPTVIVTTGVGATTALLCITTMLSHCGKYISEIVYMGTAGFPLQIGGVLNGDSSPNPSKKILHIGDGCVTPLAANWDCQSIDWSDNCESYPNVDFSPPIYGNPRTLSSFGECIFPGKVDKASMKLTRDLLGIAASPAFKKKTIKRDASELTWEVSFFKNLSVGTGVKYDYVTASTEPKWHGPDTCTEIDSTYYWSGIPNEIIARNFSAIAINYMFGLSKTQKDVLYMNAFEGIGVSQAVYAYNTNPATKKKIPFTNVRAGSDPSHYPIFEYYTNQFVSVPNTIDYDGGYAYAIASGANLVLTWLQGLCTAGVKAGSIKGSASKVCTFDVAKYYNK